MNGGKNVEGSGHGRQRMAAGTQPAEQGTAGRHSQRILRPAQASKQTATDGRPRTNNQQMAGLAANTTAARWCWPASRRTVQVDGGSTVVLAAKKVGADLPSCSYPTYRLCLSLSLPTPLICNTQFSPKLTSLFFCYFYFPLLLPHYKFVP